jgi:cation:H+ antiporter
LAFEAIIAIIALILGIVLLTYSSDKAVEHLTKIASEWGVSPFMIGVILASIGTDLPEIINSIESSLLGHGNINVGDSLGSALAQMSLVLGLLPFLARGFKVKRKKVVVIGACEILALILAVSIVEKGNISQINGLFLVASWVIFMLLTRSLTARKVKEKEHVASTDERHFHHFGVAGLGFIGVAVGAFIVIESVITLSSAFNIPEYFISFFVLAIGTSLPELVVDVMALRRKQYELAIGDIIGSSVVDASLSIGIGPLFFPITGIDVKLAMITGLYAIFVSIVIISLLAWREKVDRKIGALFIALYLFSYATLSVM